MPRPKKPGGPEPKKRSRNGCWPCKARKVKCGEEKPKCQNCERQGEPCDYSIRLNWEGRTKRKGDNATPESTGSPETPKSSGGMIGSMHYGGITRPATTAKAPPIKLERQDTMLSNASTRTSVPYDQGWERPPSVSPSMDGLQRSPAALMNRTEFQAKTLLPPDTSAIDPMLVGLGEAKYMDSANDLATPPDSGSIVAGFNGFNGFNNFNTFNNFDNNAMATTGLRDQISAAQLLRFREQAHPSYPSPADSSTNFPDTQNIMVPPYGGYQTTMPQAQMPPPFHGSLATAPHTNSFRRSEQETPTTAEHRSKRMRLSPLYDHAKAPPRYNGNPNFPIGGAYYQTAQQRSPQTHQYRPYSPSVTHVGVPLTPSSSSATSDENHARSSTKPSPAVAQDSPDLRRVSVNSLLSNDDDHVVDSHVDEPIPSFMHQCTTDAFIQTVPYGLDCGLPDLDIPRNNDLIALDASSDGFDEMVGRPTSNGANLAAEFGFGYQRLNTAHDQGNYYAKPVSVLIPRSLEPLPATLLENPMNMLYFHHFLHHTARILVPHDCSENPFKSILPQMAVSDINLLHLLLAYSASHRARLLQHPEPANRIAVWVRDVFPALRHALDSPTAPITNANLATAIMLASLEIISPNTFEVPVSWQTHLSLARSMILARGGAQSIHRQDKVSYFLSRWFAYLDVLGSLSGGKNDQPLFSGNYWAPSSSSSPSGSSPSDSDEHEFQIDCLMGFTTRCVSILAKIAELARQCDNERIRPDGSEARRHKYRGCPHRRASTARPDSSWDFQEMRATNDAFHWAGLVHLHRRVLGKPSADCEVQFAVCEIVEQLGKVRRGGTAEANLLFPMFTAGCDARDGGVRAEILERLRVVERSGMTQVRKARTLMERVWETGRPWETLVAGEFFG
ncbi:Zn(2)-C6 fungal-type DNA-binding domain [Lasallia pustulata]|uniref:Zn(2)-C6 fungal-type DNA-binding domain n=1 Tax=Lasallia pustulata TaxID=136370 RepID=A0A1W5CT01_9LECA|nr:Zn(2)-C6 fungal-type DNA-binding domain [Lasallia pustulata]